MGTLMSRHSTRGIERNLEGTITTTEVTERIVSNWASILDMQRHNLKMLYTPRGEQPPEWTHLVRLY